MPRPFELVGVAAGRPRAELVEQRRGVGVELGETAAFGGGRSAPLGRAVAGVDVFGVVHADGEHELHVALGE